MRRGNVSVLSNADDMTVYKWVSKLENEWGKVWLIEMLLSEKVTYFLCCDSHPLNDLWLIENLLVAGYAQQREGKL